MEQTRYASYRQATAVHSSTLLLLLLFFNNFLTIRTRSSLWMFFIHFYELKYTYTLCQSIADRQRPTGSHCRCIYLLNTTGTLQFRRRNTNVKLSKVIKLFYYVKSGGEKTTIYSFYNDYYTITIHSMYGGRLAILKFYVVRPVEK